MLECMRYMGKQESDENKKEVVNLKSFELSPDSNGRLVDSLVNVIMSENKQHDKNAF